jgi:hypothetical protein
MSVGTAPLATEGLPTEHSPLLAPTSPAAPAQKKKASVVLIITVLICILFTIEFGDELIQAPQVRIFESIYCRQYYEVHDPRKIGSDGGDGVREEYCKNSVIQGQVAMLRGWQVTLDGLGSGYSLFPCGRLWIGR